MTHGSMQGSIKKPPHGEPCNGCGVCCRAELCPLAMAVFGGEEFRECPAVEVDGPRVVCGLVAHPMTYSMARTLDKGAAAMSSAALTMIGSGAGCDARLYGEPSNEEFWASLYEQRRQKHKAVRAAKKVWGIADV